MRSNPVLRGAMTVSLAFGLLLVLVATPAGAATIKVNANDTTPDIGGCGGGGNACDTIQAGVDNAAVGDVVAIAKGTYTEHVLVQTNGITLRGAATLIDDNARGACRTDPSLTVFAGGPKTNACQQFGTQGACEVAWHVGRHGAASCYWDGSCRGCGPSNADNGNCTNTCTDLVAALVIEADDVTVTGLRIRQGNASGIAVAPGSADATIQRVDIRGPRIDCIENHAAGAVINSNTLHGCGADCISSLGSGVAITRNRIQSCDNHGISAAGSSLTIERNTIAATDDECILAAGNVVSIAGNRLSNCEADGIEFDGSQFSIASNRIDGTSDESIEATCRSYLLSCADAGRTVFAGGPNNQPCRQLGNQTDCEEAWHLGRAGAATCYWDGGCFGCGPNNEDAGNCTDTCNTAADKCADSSIRSNRVTLAVDDECFALDAADAGLVVERNTASHCNEEGFFIEGAGIVLRRNKVAHSASRADKAAYAVRGDGHTLEGNLALGHGSDGFNVQDSATNITLIGNRALRNARDGFDVDDASDTVLERNLARGNHAEGIEVSEDASDTVVTDNIALGNLLDFCDESASTIDDGSNRFGTTDTTCIEQENED